MLDKDQFFLEVFSNKLNINLIDPSHVERYCTYICDCLHEISSNQKILLIVFEKLLKICYINESIVKNAITYCFNTIMTDNLNEDFYYYCVDIISTVFSYYMASHAIILDFINSENFFKLRKRLFFRFYSSINMQLLKDMEMNELSLGFRLITGCLYSENISTLCISAFRNVVSGFSDDFLPSKEYYLKLKEIVLMLLSIQENCIRNEMIQLISSELRRMYLRNDFDSRFLISVLIDLVRNEANISAFIALSEIIRYEKNVEIENQKYKKFIKSCSDVFGDNYLPSSKSGLGLSEKINRNFSNYITENLFSLLNLLNVRTDDDSDLSGMVYSLINDLHDTNSIYFWNVLTNYFSSQIDSQNPNTKLNFKLLDIISEFNSLSSSLTNDSIGKKFVENVEKYVDDPIQMVLIKMKIYLSGNPSFRIDECVDFVNKINSPLLFIEVFNLLKYKDIGPNKNYRISDKNVFFAKLLKEGYLRVLDLASDIVHAKNYIRDSMDFVQIFTIIEYLPKIDLADDYVTDVIKRVFEIYKNYRDFLKKNPEERSFMEKIFVTIHNSLSKIIFKFCCIEGLLISTFFEYFIRIEKDSSFDDAEFLRFITTILRAQNSHTKIPLEYIKYLEEYSLKQLEHIHSESFIAELVAIYSRSIILLRNIEHTNTDSCNTFNSFKFIRDIISGDFSSSFYYRVLESFVCISYIQIEKFECFVEMNDSEKSKKILMIKEELSKHAMHEFLKQFDHLIDLSVEQIADEERDVFYYYFGPKELRWKQKKHVLYVDKNFQLMDLESKCLCLDCLANILNKIKIYTDVEESILIGNETLQNTFIILKNICISSIGDYEFLEKNFTPVFNDIYSRFVLPFTKYNTPKTGEEFLSLYQYISLVMYNEKTKVYLKEFRKMRQRRVIIEYILYCQQNATNNTFDFNNNPLLFTDPTIKDQMKIDNEKDREYSRFLSNNHHIFKCVHSRKMSIKLTKEEHNDELMIADNADISDPHDAFDNEMLERESYIDEHITNGKNIDTLGDIQT